MIYIDKLPASININPENFATHSRHTYIWVAKNAIRNFQKKFLKWSNSYLMPFICDIKYI